MVGNDDESAKALAEAEFWRTMAVLVRCVLVAVLAILLAWVGGCAISEYHETRRTELLKHHNFQRAWDGQDYFLAPDIGPEPQKK